MVLLGVVLTLMAVIFVSGCISTENVLYQYNLSAGQSPNYIGAQNVTIPNGTKNVTIKCENLTKLNSSLNTSYVIIYVLNTVPVTISVRGNQTSVAQYHSNIILQKTINLTNKTKSVSDNFTFNNTNIKGILIVNGNTKGTIQIITT
jgi:hypothetical protein